MRPVAKLVQQAVAVSKQAVSHERALPPPPVEARAFSAGAGKTRHTSLAEFSEQLRAGLAPGALDDVGRQRFSRLEENLLFEAIRNNPEPAAKEVARAVTREIEHSFEAARSASEPLYRRVEVRVDSGHQFLSPSGRQVDLRLTPFGVVDDGVRPFDFHKERITGRTVEDRFSADRLSPFAQQVRQKVEAAMQQRGLRVEAWSFDQRSVIVADPLEVDLAVRAERERQAATSWLQRSLTRLGRSLNILEPTGPEFVGVTKFTDTPS